MTLFVKRYDRQEHAHAAVANYAWLASLGSAVVLPELVTATPEAIAFTKLTGFTPSVADLPQLAEAIGIMHRAAASALDGARLNQPWQVGSWAISDFTESRRDSLCKASQRHGLRTSRIDAILDRTADHPPAIYKDSNLRNFLMTADGVAVVDFDDLTLAPYGYDLAKLITSLAMTHGPVSKPQIDEALANYNRTVGRNACTTEGLAIWAELNWYLTADYLGRNHYVFPWPSVRPWANPLS
ncbi:MAG TPA: phosphotransferase [Candidatus Limnocylindrales bacterium]|nr:phosphotransferase [Candidatus Limnocylindrales bacterium]